MVGGEVVAAMRRSPPAGRFSRNLRRGAQFERAELPPAYARVAVEAARVLRLEVCAVDMLDVKGRPLVFEVNSSPSIREAEAVCGVDVAGAHRRARPVARRGATRSAPPAARPGAGRAGGPAARESMAQPGRPWYAEDPQ